MKRYLVALAAACRPPLTAAATAGGRGAADDELSDAHRRAQMLERRLLRLTLDLHDGPMQHLAVIGLGLAELQRRIMMRVSPEDYETLNATISQIADGLRQVDEEIRSLIAALQADTAETPPLIDAIEAELLAFGRISPKTQVDLVVDGDVGAATRSQQIALQAVVRAALANVAQHAEAANVAIRVCGTEEAITLEIEDDGLGFSASKPVDPARLGLAGMKKRVELLGGDFRVSSRPGGPTTVAVSLHAWRPPYQPLLAFEPLEAEASVSARSASAAEEG
jgi:signal transduction histidine kinase